MEQVIVKRLMLLDLTEASKNEINLKVPYTGNSLNWLATVPQDWIDHLGGPESKLPIARACLEDALSVACQAEYALEQAYAHKIWFQKECPNAPRDSDAHHYCRFYADDCVLRLFSAAEHLANFIVELLNISSTDLKRKGDDTGALAGVVGKYLAKKMPDNRITKIIYCLNSDEWKLLRTYRHDWVHNKPQILDSPGLDYRRRNRWTTFGHSKMIALGGRQPPDLSLDALLSNTSQAASDFSKALEKLTDIFFQELEILGIKRDIDSGTINPPDDYWTRTPPDGDF